MQDLTDQKVIERLNRSEGIWQRARCGLLNPMWDVFPTIRPMGSVVSDCSRLANLGLGKLTRSHGVHKFTINAKGLRVSALMKSPWG